MRLEYQVYDGKSFEGPWQDIDDNSVLGKHLPPVFEEIEHLKGIHLQFGNKRVLMIRIRKEVTSETDTRRQ